MACYHPNVMVKDEHGEWKFSGKFSGSVYEETFKLDGKRHFFDGSTGEVFEARLSDFVLVPCGQCAGCRIDRSRHWADRLMMEKACYPDDQTWFVTITYDADHVPWTRNDEGMPVMTLEPDHVSQFMKRLRTYSGISGIRFYAAGEYGEKTKRPHYHLILYGLPEQLLRLSPFGASMQGYQYYKSDLIGRAWTYGFHSITRVDWNTCAYVARYVVKKLTGDAAAWYKQQHIKPEFSRMSLRPGIGKDYYVNHKEQILKDDKIVLSTGSGGRSFVPHGYIDKLIKDEYPSLYERNKAARLAKVADTIDFKMANFDGTYLDLLATEEKQFKERIKSLKRGDF